MAELKEIIEKSDQLSKEVILLAAAEARKEHQEGKTTILSSPEEIKKYFLKLVED